MKRIDLRTIAAALLAYTGLFPGLAFAQSMRPLEEAAEEAAAPYLGARCGGLYQALMEWGGRDRLGEELWQSTDAARESAILFSMLVAQRVSGGELEMQIEGTLRDVRNIADLYHQRFEQNYALTGQAFEGDALVTQDMNYCSDLVTLINATPPQE